MAPVVVATGPSFYPCRLRAISGKDANIKTKSQVKAQVSPHLSQFHVAKCEVGSMHSVGYGAGSFTGFAGKFSAAETVPALAWNCAAAIAYVTFDQTFFSC